MRRFQEFQNPNSCFNKAEENEMVFVLLGRDAAACIAIRAWVMERIRRGMNLKSDPKIIEALACADTMEKEAGPIPALKGETQL